MDLKAVVSEILKSGMLKESALVDFDRLNTLIPSDWNTDQIEELLLHLQEAGYLIDQAPEQKAEAQDTPEIDFTNALAHYIQEVMNLKRLSDQEKLELFSDWKKGDRKSRDRLAHSFLPLVLHTAREFGRRREDILELIQEGNLALVEALESFQPVGRKNLRDFVRWNVRKAVSKAYAKWQESRDFPKSVTSFFERFRQVASELRQKLSRHPHLEEIAHSMQMKESEIRRLLALGGSLSEENVDEADAILARHVRDIQGSEERQDEEWKALQNLVALHIEKLSPLEQEIMSLIYGLDGHPVDVQDVALDLGLSLKHVQNFQKVGLERILKLAQQS